MVTWIVVTAAAALLAGIVATALTLRLLDRRREMRVRAMYTHIMSRDMQLGAFLNNMHADIVAEIHSAAAGVDRSLAN